MLNVRTFSQENPPLQPYYWPPVEKFTGFGADFSEFMQLSMHKQHDWLAALRLHPEMHAAFLQKSLSAIYSYILGYQDSPCYLRTNDILETHLHRAKIVLEREMLEQFLQPEPPPEDLNIEAACNYLRHYVQHNPGVHHPFFAFLSDEASRMAFEKFLLMEVVRNEVVDDEVALIGVGLQGLMKKVISSNLWDECGNGNLRGFHTYWLRCLLEHTGNWQFLESSRRDGIPWFSTITSNSLNMSLTRSGYKYRAYGHFLVNEGWVAPHFEQVVAGLHRVGLDHRDITVYFTKHLRIDPHHTDELLEGMLYQQPSLLQEEIHEIVVGAHSAVSAGVHMYNRILQYLK